MRHLVLWGMGAVLGFALVGCGGKPSDSSISAMLQEAAQASLKVNGFEVPAEAVEVDGIDVELVQEIKGNDGLERFLVIARVTTELKQSGETISEGMRNASRQSARTADIRSIESVVMGAAFGGAAARNALRDYSVGAQFTYPLEAVLTKIDGTWKVSETQSEVARFTGATSRLAKASAVAEAETTRANATQQSAIGKLAALPETELKSRTTAALADHRLCAPEGNNAVEYQLALRQRSGALDFSTMLDVMPHMVIAAEQAVHANDYAEASRLLNLLKLVDAQHPALPRLDDVLTKKIAANVPSGVIPGTSACNAAIATTADAGAAAPSATMPTTPEYATDAAADSAESEADAREVALRTELRQEEAKDRAQYEETQRAASERAGMVREAEQRELEQARKEADALKRVQDEHASKLDAEDAAGN